MQTALIAFALALAAPTAVEGFETPASQAPLKLSAKAAIFTGTAAPRTQAPFVPSVREPELELMPRQHDERAQSKQWTCSGESSLCYDPEAGRVVYKPARNYMPDIPGLRRENVSVKRDRIILRYSF